MRGPQPQYPNVNADSLEISGQAYQQKSSNEAQFRSYGNASPTGQTRDSPLTLEQNRAYDGSPYVVSTTGTAVAPQYDANEYQYRSNPSVSIPQGHSPQPLAVHRWEQPQSFKSIPRKAVPYSSPPIQGQPLPEPLNLSGRHASNQSQRNTSPYSPSGADATLTPDRSVIGSPLPQMSPDSLHRELEKTKDYSENILTKLIETTNLLRERDVEIASLHGRLANTDGSKGSFQQYGGGSSWEIDELRQKLYEHSQALRTAQDDSATARSQAQYQQSQADMFARECSRLRESQRQTQPNQAQNEEARKVTEFYKQKVDQLSRDNMNIMQQNRKLTEEWAATQRDVQQQGSRMR
ncbi:MAG: hypothetical protein Q9160_008461 [Pyrenula sp. 1 TL-2023]